MAGTANPLPRSQAAAFISILRLCSAATALTDWSIPPPFHRQSRSTNHTFDSASTCSTVARRLRNRRHVSSRAIRPPGPLRGGVSSNALVPTITDQSRVLCHLGSNRGPKDHGVVSIARPGFTHRHNSTIAMSHHHLHVHRATIVLAPGSSSVIPRRDQRAINDPEFAPVRGCRAEELLVATSDRAAPGPPAFD